MRFIGYSHREYGYLSFVVTGGNQYDSIGDQVWISADGKELLVHECCDKSTLMDVAQLFDKQEEQAEFLNTYWDKY